MNYKKLAKKCREELLRVSDIVEGCMKWIDELETHVNENERELLNLASLRRIMDKHIDCDNTAECEEDFGTCIKACKQLVKAEQEIEELKTLVKKKNKVIRMATNHIPHNAEEAALASKKEEEQWNVRS
jgi:hypothetical protein